MVDLETTGGSPAADGVTEIGAVLVRGGEVVGELQTLVDPGVPVPPQIALLTGITDAMLVGAPRMGAALPAFLDFAEGSVLVAHNAGFDIAFLKAACTAQGRPWPRFEVVDTVALARRLVTSDEVPNRKLGTLAAYFRATTTPEHRALADARATVDVLHALLGRARGVTTVEDLLDFCRTDDGRRARRHLVDGLPSAPGVYRFVDAGGRVLYVGSSLDVRTRVRSYFTASEKRRRMTEMVQVARSVEHVVCATAIEAQVREVRLIAEHRPGYNRRSTRPDRAAWVKLTDEPAPRLSVVAAPGTGPPGGGLRRAVLVPGPGPGGRRGGPHRLRHPPLHAADLPAGRRDGLRRWRAWAAAAPRASPGPTRLRRRRRRGARGADRRPVPARGDVMRRVHRLSEQQRYEEAAAERDRLAALVRGVDRAQQVRALDGRRRAARRPAARRRRLGAGVHPARPSGRQRGDPGRGAGAPHHRGAAGHGRARRGPRGPAPAALPEESTLLVRWLETPGTRLVSSDAGWSLPVGGAPGGRSCTWSRAAGTGRRCGGSRVTSGVSPGGLTAAARRLSRARTAGRPAPRPPQRRPRPLHPRRQRAGQVGGDVGRAAACRPRGPARAGPRRR